MFYEPDKIDSYIDQSLDLSEITFHEPVSVLSIPFARVKKLPDGVDWSRLERLSIRWHPCWEPLLSLKSLRWLEITYATQEALESIASDSLEFLQLNRPRLSENDPWFPAGLKSAVVVDSAAKLDLSNARSLSEIPMLSFRRIRELHGLANASKNGRIRKLVLDEIKQLHPVNSLWDIDVDQAVIIGEKRNTSWLYDSWDSRPLNWKSHWRFGPNLSKSLDPERAEDPLPFF